MHLQSLVCYYLPTQGVDGIAKYKSSIIKHTLSCGEISVCAHCFAARSVFGNCENHSNFLRKSAPTNTKFCNSFWLMAISMHLYVVANAQYYH